jgi:hypothetical protein
MSASREVTNSDQRRAHILSMWNLDSVRLRVMNRMNWSASYAKAVESEYRKFFLLAAHSEGLPFGMAGVVDEFWHEHIIDTLNYERMCIAVAGRFIHHVPTDGENIDPTDYERTLKYLADAFGDVSPIWPRAVVEKMNGKCSLCKEPGHPPREIT